MRVTVVGAGAVGGYFGGRMHETGLHVTFLVREQRAEQLRRTGLRIKSQQGDTCIQNVKLAAHPEEIEACDVVVVAVKNYHLEQVIEQIRPLVNKGAKVLPLLNGVEHFELLQMAFGEEAVMGGTCQIIATLDKDGQIVQIGRLHDMMIGALRPSQEPLCRQISEALADANLRCLFKENITQELWWKYAFITAFSGITTATRLEIGQVLAVEPTQDVFRAALSEMQKLAKARNVPLPENFADIIVQKVGQLPEGSTSSMHQDLTKGLPLEVESLHGGALRLAARCGVELPTIKTLYGIIKPFEQGSAKRL